MFAKKTTLFTWLVSAVALAAVNPSPPAKAAFERAEKALADNKLDDAVAAYKQALVATPNYPDALNGLGSALFRQNKRDEAITNFRAAIEADPSFKLGWFNLGYATRKTQDYKTAAQAYEKYTALDPKDPDGFYGLAESYRNLNDNPKAIAAYQTYLTKENRPTETKYIEKAKGYIAELKAQDKGGSTTAGRAEPPPSKSESGEAITTASGRKVAEGDKFWADKKYREASFSYQDAVNADPNNTEALFKLGNAYAVLAYYTQAIEKWNRVAELSTNADVRRSAQDNIAKAQAKMAETGGGSPQAQNKPPGSGPVADNTRAQARESYEAAVKQISAAEYGKALSSLNECLRLEPALSVGYIARGSALIGLKRFSEAVTDYQYSLRLDPNLAAPLYGLAEAYRGMNRNPDARGYYQKYVASTAPDARPELQSDARAKIEQLKGY